MIAITDHPASKKDMNVEQSSHKITDRLLPYGFKNNTITWYFVDDTVKNVTPFKYYSKRNIGHVNNDIATNILVCNDDVTSVDKACFFYLILYQTKHNQKEESCK